MVKAKTIPKQKVKIIDGFKDIGQAGRVVLMASDDDEYSWESATLQNSVFTYYILEGLVGAADADADGKVSAEEAFDYALPLVQAFTAGAQNPQIYDGYDGEIEIVGYVTELKSIFSEESAIIKE